VADPQFGWERGEGASMGHGVVPARRRAFGACAEDAAAEYLRDAGWEIEARNIMYRCGEIDIVAWDGAVRVFVEVRSGRDRGIRPEDTVTRKKQRRLVRAATLYLQRVEARSGAARRRVSRFDVVSVSSVDLRVLRHHRNAFEVSGPR
jgi:putative endonuclease